jgi:hypothetical protein
MRKCTNWTALGVLAAVLAGCSFGGTGTRGIQDYLRGTSERTVCFEDRPTLPCFKVDEANGTFRPKPTGKATIQHAAWFAAIRRMDGTPVASVPLGGELAIISPDAYARRNPGEAVWHIVGTGPGAKAVKTRFGAIHLPIRPVSGTAYVRSGVSGIGLENSDSLADDPTVDKMESAGQGLRPKGRVAGIASDGSVRWTADDVVLIRPGPNGWAFVHAEGQKRDGPQTHTVTDENFVVLGKERATNYASFNTIAPADGAPGFERRVTTAGQGERLVLAERLEANQYRVVFPRATPTTTPGGRGAIPILRSSNTTNVTLGAQRAAPEGDPKSHWCTYKMPTECVGSLVGWVVPVQSGNETTMRFADPTLAWATGERYRRFRLVQFDGVPDAELVVAERIDGTAHVLRASYLPSGTVMFVPVAYGGVHPNMAAADQAALATANQAAQALYGRELKAYQAAVRQADQQRREWENYQRYLALAEQRSDAELCEKNDFTDPMQKKAWREVCGARRNAMYEAQQRAAVEAWSRNLDEAGSRKPTGPTGTAPVTSGGTIKDGDFDRRMRTIDENLRAIKDPNRNGAAGAAQRY